MVLIITKSIVIVYSFVYHLKYAVEIYRLSGHSVTLLSDKTSSIQRKLKLNFRLTVSVFVSKTHRESLPDMSKRTSRL